MTSHAIAPEENISTEVKLSLARSPDWIHQIEGGLWKIASCACFAGINGIVRYLTGGGGEGLETPLPIYIIIFFQSVFAAMIMLPSIVKATSEPWQTTYKGIHLIRVLTAVVGTGLWYSALYYMPITQVVALGFTGPIFTVIGARLLLSEHIDRKRFLAISLSFIGAFIILRPDNALLGYQGYQFGWITLLPLAAAVAFASSKLCTRKLGSAGESVPVMTFYLLVLMIPFSLFPALMNWVTPSLHHWPWLIAIGFLGMGAHYCLTKSLSIGEVSFVMPFGSSKILICALVGYLAFDEFPQGWSIWLGFVIIFLSVMLLSGKMQYNEKGKGVAT